jgi:hypothetical protein
MKGCLCEKWNRLRLKESKHAASVGMITIPLRANGQNGCDSLVGYSESKALTSGRACSSVSGKRHDIHRKNRHVECFASAVVYPAGLYSGDNKESSYPAIFFPFRISRSLSLSLSRLPLLTGKA